MQQILFCRSWAIISVILLFCGIFPDPACGAMVEMTDTEMAEVRGKDGIMIAIKDVQIFQYIDNYLYTAPANEFGTTSFLSLGGIKMINSNGGPGLYNFGTSNPLNGIIYYDMGQCDIAAPDSDWNFGTVQVTQKLFMGMEAPYWDQDVGFLISNIVMGSGSDIEDLGLAFLGQFDLRSFNYYTAPHGDGTDFEFDFELHLDTIRYVYNEKSSPECGMLAFNNIHIGQTLDSAWELIILQTLLHGIHSAQTPLLSANLKSATCSAMFPARLQPIHTPIQPNWMWLCLTIASTILQRPIILLLF
jgi:hypothetical protein